MARPLTNRLQLMGRGAASSTPRLDGSGPTAEAQVVRSHLAAAALTALGRVHDRVVAALPLSLALVAATACGSAAGSQSPDASHAAAHPAASNEGLSGSHAFDGRLVTYTVGPVMQTAEGASVRRVAFSEAGKPGNEYLLPVDRNIDVWFSRAGTHLSMRPRSELTWGDVHSEADLVFALE